MNKRNPFAGTEPAPPTPSLLRALHHCNPRLAQREYDRWLEICVDAGMREAAWISAHASSDEDEAAQLEALTDRLAWTTSEGISPESKRRTWAAAETMSRL
nr:hypothetical protein [Thermoleophilaceae bacterium]